MMDAIGAYVLRICCSAVIAGIVLTVGGEGPGSKTRKMICGLFMAFVVISPLREVKLSDLWELPEDLYQQGQDITASAQADTNNAISDIIIQRTRTYILDEASSLHIQLQVDDVRLDQDTLAPVQVELRGEIAPYQRALMSDFLADTLGIEKEDQIWNQ